MALSVVAGATWCAIAEAAPPCGYSSVQVGDPVPCGDFFPSTPIPKSLNNLGQWAGYRYLCPPNDLFAVPLRWSEETGVTIIPTPPGVISAGARALNDMGTVVGTFRNATHPDWACIWLPDGQFIEIPPSGGNPPTSWAADVNNSNVVVGWRTAKRNIEAFIWHAEITTIIDPAIYGWTSARAQSVSDSGFVVGQFGSDSGGTGRAFRWQDGGVEILQPLAGALTSNGRGVNAGGVTVGNSRFQDGFVFRQHATVWGRDAQPVELPVLTGYKAWAAIGINDDGLVLGIVNSPSKPGLPSSQYVVWIDGQVYSMTSLLGPGHGEIQDLNDVNQLVSAFGVVVLFSPETVPGDLNGDCAVDGADLVLLLEQWGKAANASADLNSDGEVDGADLAILLGAWTTTR